MTVVVRLFGPQALLAGTRELEVEAAVAPTVAELLRLVERRAPALGPSLPHTRVAIDHELVVPETMVPQGAEVALLGMMSGG